MGIQNRQHKHLSRYLAAKLSRHRRRYGHHRMGLSLLTRGTRHRMLLQKRQQVAYMDNKQQKSTAM